MKRPLDGPSDKSDMPRYTVELLHHDSPTRFRHFGVLAIVMGKGWVTLYKEDDTIIHVPSENLVRVKQMPQVGPKR